MEFYIEKQLLNILYSLILGLIFGALYDIIRIVHILCGIMSYSDGNRELKSGKLSFFLFFIFDLVYSVAVILLYSLFIYWADNGRVRLYLMLTTAVGFYIYYNTIGRLVMLCSEFIVKLTKKLVKVLVIIPVCFVAGCVFVPVRIICLYTVHKLVKSAVSLVNSRRMKKYLSSLENDIGFIQTNKNHKRRSDK